MLKIEHLQKTFNAGTVNEKVVFRDLNLTVEEGEFVTVIGSNGAGKSTMLSAIAGSMMPDSGRITLNGRDITYMPEVKRASFIGRVFQDPMMGTAANMWIEENLALAYRRAKPKGLRWGMPVGEEKELYKKQLARLGLGLEDRLQTKVGLLSGGQRQAITLVMATVRRPEILLLDEHTAALDPKTAATVLEISNDIVRENGLTTLMVTHNMKNAIEYGDRLVMMHNGGIILDISGEEKKQLTVEKLLQKFEEVSGSSDVPDAALLG
ncbi:MAG: ABC transporter ATP-binding protein [Firmicutes bacterium]|nr:ABC transporter ATP-binding protein [Bacillota bacterium]